MKTKTAAMLIENKTVIIPSIIISESINSEFLIDVTDYSVYPELDFTSHTLTRNSFSNELNRHYKNTKIIDKIR